MELWIAKISIILILFQLFFNLIKIIFRIPLVTNTLQCGIYGFSGKAKLNRTDLRLALAKFKILGIYNETRGKDSCGVLVNNKVAKGTGPKKLFTDFIEDTIFDVSIRYRVMIGHNRSASVGFQANEKNQHPFLIEDDLLLTHNGTIKETYKFCEKYQLPFMKLDVDSEMLAMALYKNGTDVLNSYKGGAALAYTFKSRPNSLYLYHGASKTTKNGKEVEERPLFYMETKEGIYYSSLAEALNAIRETDEEEPYMLAHNTVTEIIDGEFTYQDVQIDRGDSNVEPEKEYPRKGGFGNYSGGFNNYHHTGYYPSESMRNALPMSRSYTKQVGYNAGSRSRNSTDVLSLKKESMPKRALEDVYSNYVYFYRGRYWAFYADKGPADQAQAHGAYIISAKKGYIEEEEGDGKEVLYFYKGVLLKDRAAFAALGDLEGVTHSWLDDSLSNWAKEMSKYAAQPVYANEGEGASMYRFHFDEKEYDGTFTPRFSGRSYSVKKGYLFDIKSSHKEEMCYHYDIDMAIAERALYMKGGIVGKPETPPEGVLISGGDQQLLPFFKKKFKNKSEIIETFKDSELTALDAYLKWFLENDAAWTVDLKDVQEFRQNCFDDLLKKSYTLEDYISDAEGLRILKDAYKKSIIEINKENIISTHIDINEPRYLQDPKIQESQQYKLYDDDDIDDDTIEDAMFEEPQSEVVTLVEEILDNFSELHDNASELATHETEEAQAMAANLYATIDNFRSTCENDRAMVQNPEFANFIKNLKGLKNGVI